MRYKTGEENTKINLEGLQLNGIYLLVFADDGNLMAEDKNVIKENTETSLQAGKEHSVEVNADKSKCRMQTAKFPRLISVILQLPVSRVHIFTSAVCSLSHPSMSYFRFSRRRV
jgi:hypothetical protein